MIGFCVQGARYRAGRGLRPAACMCSSHISRRDVLAAGAAAILSTVTGRIAASDAAMYDYSVKADVQFTLPKENSGDLNTYLPQIRAGLDTLVKLQSNWEESTKDFDGDVVRRVLGTVGTKSALFNIKKALEGAWKTQVAMERDIDELETLKDDYEEILIELSQVDFQLYSVNFTELRPTKQNLIDQGKQTLDKLVDRYKGFLELLTA